MRRKGLGMAVAWAVLTAVAVTAGTSGCATVKKKFTRKKKETEVRPVVYTERDYVKPYTNAYYYANNYNMWKVWHSELLSSVEGNAKRMDRAATEAVSRLKEMQSYLEEPKRAELGDQIASLERAIANVQDGVSDKSGGQARFMLEKSMRVIKADFGPDAVQASIKKDQIVL